MRQVKIKLTDEEFKLLDKYRGGIPKQTYCKKRILGEFINEPDFESEQFIEGDNPNFCFNVSFKLSPKERDVLDELRGDMTLQEFCRKSVLNQKIISFDELQEIKYQLAKIGGNVNQIARVANQTGFIDKKSIDNFTGGFTDLRTQVMKLENNILKRVE